MQEKLPKAEADIFPKVYALCLFITDESGNVLIFQNNQTKESTQKIRGQFTTPAETIETGEKLIRDALPRTISEEVGSIYGATPKFRGVVILDTPRTPIRVVSLEIPTLRESVHIDPKDTSEVSNPIWVPLEDITSDKIFRLSNFDIPLYRDPIPALAQNVLKARRGESFPTNQVIRSRIPNGLYDFLKDNPGPVYSVK